MKRTTHSFFIPSSKKSASDLSEFIKSTFRNKGDLQELNQVLKERELSLTELEVLSRQLYLNSKEVNPGISVVFSPLLDRVITNLNRIHDFQNQDKKLLLYIIKNIGMISEIKWIKPSFMLSISTVESMMESIVNANINTESTYHISVLFNLGLMAKKGVIVPISSSICEKVLLHVASQQYDMQNKMLLIIVASNFTGIVNLACSHKIMEKLSWEALLKVVEIFLPTEDITILDGLLRKLSTLYRGRYLGKKIDTAILNKVIRRIATEPNFQENHGHRMINNIISYSKSKLLTEPVDANDLGLLITRLIQGRKIPFKEFVVCLFVIVRLCLNKELVNSVSEELQTLMLEKTFQYKTLHTHFILQFFDSLRLLATRHLMEGTLSANWIDRLLSPKHGIVLFLEEIHTFFFSIGTLAQLKKITGTIDSSVFLNFLHLGTNLELNPRQIQSIIHSISNLYFNKNLSEKLPNAILEVYLKKLIYWERSIDDRISFPIFFDLKCLSEQGYLEENPNLGLLENLFFKVCREEVNFHTMYCFSLLVKQYSFEVDEITLSYIAFNIFDKYQNERNAASSIYFFLSLSALASTSTINDSRIKDRVICIASDIQNIPIFPAKHTSLLQSLVPFKKYHYELHDLFLHLTVHSQFKLTLDLKNYLLQEFSEIEAWFQIIMETETDNAYQIHEIEEYIEITQDNLLENWLKSIELEESSRQMSFASPYRFLDSSGQIGDNENNSYINSAFMW